MQLWVTAPIPDVDAEPVRMRQSMVTNIGWWCGVLGW